MKAGKASIDRSVDQPSADVRLYLFHGPDEAQSRALAARLLEGLEATKFLVTAGGMARALGPQALVATQAGSFPSIDKTTEVLLGLKPMTLFDATIVPGAKMNCTPPSIFQPEMSSASGQEFVRQTYSSSCRPEIGLRPVASNPLIARFGEPIRYGPVIPVIKPEAAGSM